MTAREPRLIYVASPYSHPSGAVREARLGAVCRAAVQLMKAGALVFSPIAYSELLTRAGNLPTDWAYWAAMAGRMVAACDVLVVLMLDGWELSVGVRGEIAIAERLGLPVIYLTEAQLPAFCAVQRRRPAAAVAAT